MSKHEIILKALNLQNSLAEEDIQSINSIELHELEGEAYNNAILQIIKKIYHNDLKISGEHRKPDWENGWEENYNNLKSSHHIDSLKPGYFSNSVKIRINGRLYEVNDTDAERKILHIKQRDLFKKFAPSIENVYEFGCGSGSNLINLRHSYPNARIVGLDWAESSQKIIEQLVISNVMENISGSNFDFFKPDYQFRILDNSLLFTCAALEQVGSRWQAFVDYILDQCPTIVINIEPMGELLDSNNLLDFLSIEYSTKRNYLKNYFSGLLELEKMQKIKIIHHEKSFIGSEFINGYSIVVWKIN